MKIEIELTSAEWKEWRDFMKRYFETDLSPEESFALFAKATILFKIREIIKAGEEKVEQEPTVRRKMQLTKPSDVETLLKES